VKVKLLIPRAAASGSQSAGDVVDVSEAEADRLVKMGLAEVVDARPKVERAVRTPKPEKAVK